MILAAENSASAESPAKLRVLGGNFPRWHF
jgi:hypothetical protein